MAQENQTAVCAIAYRSVVSPGINNTQLAELLAHSREHNKINGITGFLLLDRGVFFQWFEGAPDTVQRLWSLIKTDNRHTQVEELGRIALPMRMFSEWDMQLGLRETETLPAIDGCVAVAGLMLNAMQKQTELVPQFWRRLYSLYHAAGIVKEQIPTGERTPLHSVPNGPSASALKASALVPDYADPALNELINRVLGSDPEASAQLVDALQERGMSTQTILLDLFEPAARRLGDLWQDDQCNDFEISLALERLQAITHKLGEDFHIPGSGPAPKRKALLATQPGERHSLGVGLSLEFYLRAGWDVTCAFPRNDEELDKLLHDESFDVLDLSLSNVFNREDQIDAMAVSVRKARAQSLNAALVVLAGGRVFLDHPEAASQIGADAGYSSVVQSVPLADALLRPLPLQRISSKQLKKRSKLELREVELSESELNERELGDAEGNETEAREVEVDDAATQSVVAQSANAQPVRSSQAA